MISGSHNDEEFADVMFILKEFFIERDGAYHHERADEIIQKGLTAHNKRLEGWKKRKHDELNMTSLSTHESVMPDSSTQPQPQPYKPRAVKGSTVDKKERFEKGEGLQNAPPENLHPLNYARKILEDLNFPVDRGNLQSVAEAITAEVRTGKSVVAAFEFVLAGVKDAKDEGIEINRFFFSDAKYRGENRRSKKSRKELKEEELTRRFGK
jgi:hypothetical protein